MKILSKLLSDNTKIVVLRTKNKKLITIRIEIFLYIISLGSKDVTITISTSLTTRLLKKKSIKRLLREMN